MLPTVLLLHSDTSQSLFMWKQNSLRRGAQTSKFEQDVLEPKDHLLMLIAAAAQRSGCCNEDTKQLPPFQSRARTWVQL